MKTSTLGMLAIFVLLAGALAYPASDAFAVNTKKPLSSTEKNMEDQKIKDAEKRHTETPQMSTSDETKPVKTVVSSTDIKEQNDKVTDAERDQGSMATTDANMSSEQTKPMKKEVSASDIKAQNDKIKQAEKKSSDNSSQAKEKSVSKLMVSTKHRQTTIKKQRLAAGIKH